ncbi:MAG: ATP-binding protein [Bacillota bacterium]
MKKVTVISGKGGTGKTIVTANLTALADQLVLADCDVDAPNMHLLMQPKIKESKEYRGSHLAVKDESKCIDCGLCAELCNFDAIDEEFRVNEFKCEGCGLCTAKCPTEALTLKPEVTGEIFNSQTRFGPMVHAKLGVGAENSGKLVSQVSQRAEDIAREKELELLLVDGSPGIGCPVVASLSGTDYAVVVTEPTKSGLADLKRVLEAVAHFGITPLVVINKSDLNEGITAEIEGFCQQEEISLVGKVPFDKAVMKAMQQGKLVVESRKESSAAVALNQLWKNIKSKLKEAN